MKVLQINTVYRVKSTGRTCYELSMSMEKAGHECYTAYGFGFWEDKNSYRIGNNKEYYFHNISSRVTGKQGYYSVNGTKRLINYIKKINPDIIHLRNLHANYLNLPILFDYLANADIPVVLNLHDCWAFTGKCAHYTEIGCYKWKTQCGKCPKIKEYPSSIFRDFTTTMYEDKKKWFSSIKNLTVVGVSKWVAEQARQSFLSNRSITSIYNWIDHEIFKPYQEEVFQKYDIEDTKFTIIGVSAIWSNDSPRLQDFRELAKIINDDMQIILVGQTQGTINEIDKIKFIPFVDNTKDLAKLYSSADVYVHLSVEDTFGKVIAEAMACGTPAIVYNSTACPEIIGEGCGYIAEPRDVEQIYNHIVKIKENGKQYYSDNCVRFTKENYNYEKNVGKLLEIYTHLSEESKKC
ncbi:glycosyltransferase [Paenibacillus sp. FJAT-27812]|uniref:glycosyltransferase n=1 Tax=Paenibacillus sp. FJAT-27812 TaxID=1684143 RepID=UPI0006A78810|nr:glycosyltransferase [Paenibacillus sp. FJAT-27812]